MSKLDTSQILKCQGEREKKKKKYRPSKTDVALFPPPEICVEKPDWSRVKKKKFRKRSQKEIKVEFQLKKKKKGWDSGSHKGQTWLFYFLLFN